MKKLLIIPIIALLAACAPMNATPDKVHVQNGTYVSGISATDARRESDNFMIVTVTGETYEDTTLYWRVVWFDANGIEINSGALATPKWASVRRGQPFHWTAIAPNPRATSYKVYVSDRPINQ